jgi:Tfp pilus assembly protein PilO
MDLTAIGILLTLVLAILGWVYQLGRQDARQSRSEADIQELKALQQACKASHTQDEKDLRLEIRESFNKVYSKIDALPCHNPGWKKEACG